MPLKDVPRADTDDYVPGDSSIRITYRGFPGLMLDGVLLSKLGADGVDKPTGKNATCAGIVMFAPGGTAVNDTATEKPPTVEDLSVGALAMGGGAGIAAMTPAAEERSVVVVL